MLNEQQLESRALGIGGSEAAAVCGLSPWKTPVMVWQEKRGVVPPPDLSNLEHIQWGTLLEDVIADEWARRTKNKAHRVRETLVSKQHPFMLANIDRRVVGKREGLEIKNSSAWQNDKWGELGSDDVPLYYLMQGVHYLHVLDYDVWNYAVLLGGNELLHYRVERDLDTEKRLINLEGAFWECVQSGKPPPPIKVEDLTRLWRKTHGRCEATPEILDQVMRAKEIKATVKPLADELDAIKLEVGTFMADAGDLFDPAIVEAPVATYRAHDETRVDVKGVREKLKPKIIELIEIVRAMERDGDVEATIAMKQKATALNTLEIAMLEQKGPAAFADLVIASMLKTSPVRKFLTK